MRKILLFLVFALLFSSLAFSYSFDSKIRSYCPLNESSGTTVACSHGVVGTITGATWKTATYDNTKYVLSYDGDDKVIFNSDVLTTQNFAVAWWFNNTDDDSCKPIGNQKEIDTSGFTFSSCPNLMLIVGTTGSWLYTAIGELFSIQNNTQYFIVVNVNNNGTWTGYVNGTETGRKEMGSYTFQPSGRNFAWGVRADDTSGEYFEGELGEFWFFNDTLTNAEVSELYNDLIGGAPEQPTFEIPTPTDGAYNITNQIINVSCATGNISLWWDNNSDPITLVLDNIPSPANYSTNENETDIYYYKASCDNGATNSSPRTLTLDFEFPIITLTPSNAFDSNNISQTNNYNSSVPLNITVFDDRDLFAFEVLGYYSNGTYVYNYTNLSLSGSTFNFSTIVDFTAVKPNSIIYFNVSASDSHTNNKIKDYNVIKIKDGLEFITSEGNDITIETDGTDGTSAEKLGDRYTFKFEFDNKAKKERVFKLKSKSGPIYYRPDSEYAGHFIIGDANGGNWIDFETDEDTDFIIEKQNNHYYKIIFSNLGDITFNSIGGLNVEQQQFKYYYGGYTLYASPEPALSELPAVIYLNITRGLGIETISATLYYNETYWPPDRTTEYSNYTIFEVDIIEGVVVDTTQYMKWNITYNQTDSSLISFNTTISQHNVSAWFFDSCEVSNTTAFIVEIRNEKTNLPITVNLTISTDYWNEGNPGTIKHYQNNLYNNNTFTYCKAPPSAIFYGDITFILEGAGLGTRTIQFSNTLFNDTFFLMALETGDNSDYITFRIVDEGGEAIEGAAMQIYRIVNATDTLIYRGEGDFAGQITTFLDQLYTYDFIINASGYPLKTFELMPAQTTYTITLTGTGTSYTSDYEGIRFKIVPDVNLINLTNDFFNITFYVEGDDIEQIGINFTNHNYECNPVSCSIILAGEGSVTLGIKVNETGTFNTAYWFQKNGQDRIYVNDGIIKGVAFIYQAGASIVQFFDRIKENTSPNTRTVLAAIFSVMAVGVGASLGLFGTLLLIPVALANIFFCLPSINFIHPLVGGFMAVFSLAIVVFVSMRDL